MKKTIPLIVWVVIWAGCNINGNPQSHPGASIFQPDDGSFHFHYLSPPWRTAATEEAQILKLVIDAYGELFPNGEKLSHILKISYAETANARQEAQKSHAAAIQKGRISNNEPAEIISLTGESGWEFISYQEVPQGRNYFRDCFYPDSEGRVVHFAIAGAFPMDEQNIEDLVHSFSSGPDPGTEVPPRISRLLDYQNPCHLLVTAVALDRSIR